MLLPLSGENETAVTGTSVSEKVSLETGSLSLTMYFEITPGILASMNLSPESDENYEGGEESSSQAVPHDVVSRRKAWEAGNIDYMGGDSFAMIQKKLDESIGTHLQIITAK